jgi:biotin operon repressor
MDEPYQVPEDEKIVIERDQQQVILDLYETVLSQDLIASYLHITRNAVRKVLEANEKV